MDGVERHRGNSMCSVNNKRGCSEAALQGLVEEENTDGGAGSSAWCDRQRGDVTAVTIGPNYKCDRFAKPLAIKPLLVAAAVTSGVLWSPGFVASDDDCDVDECMTVTATRPSCPAFVICSSSPPQLSCWRALTYDTEAIMKDNHKEHRDRNSGGGIDIKVPDGTPIFAAMSGTVSTTMDDWEKGKGDNGNYIRIDYDDGTQGAYIHLQDVHVVEGQRVEAGAYIGTSNSTGAARGAHLHYSLWDSPERNEQIDPVSVHGDNCR